MGQFPHAQVPGSLQTDERMAAFMEDVRLLLKDIQILGDNLKILTGTGSPEGTRLANPGSVYLRKDGPPALYMKETGNGTTGWVSK